MLAQLLARMEEPLFIAVVNAHRDMDIECLISLKDFIPERRERVFELNAKDINAYNSKENRDNVKVEEKPSIEIDENFTYAFPAHSATVIEMPSR